MARKRGAAATIVASIGIFFAQPAGAQGVGEQMRAFGLLGKWAVNCAQPADGDAGNTHALYSMISGDRAQLRYVFGPKYGHRIYTITAARRLDDNRLQIENHDNSDGLAQRTIIRKAQGRIQNVSAQEIRSGKVWVMNGIATANGRPVPWLERCP